MLDALQIEHADLVTHDIGNMVGYAFAAQYPTGSPAWSSMDAPLPGIGPWDEIVRQPALWHFNFGGPDAERLVAGRERIYLDRFWNEFSADPTTIRRGDARALRRALRQPGAMHAGFAQFAAFDQDAERQQGLPRQGQAGDAGAGHRRRRSPSAPTMAVVMRDAADERARELVIAELRPLADGGAARGDDRRDPRLPR